MLPVGTLTPISPSSRVFAARFERWLCWRSVEIADLSMFAV
ncbi:MAG: hypothetical protein ACI9NC_003395 [Verrucomicrobiales bacterium]